jgi:hypothetical protein
VEPGGEPRPPDGSSALPPWQFLVRAAAVVTGLTLLLVDVDGPVFFIAWALIVLALVSEGIATLTYRRQSRSGRQA